MTDYQVVIVGVDEPMVKAWIENYEIVATDQHNETDARKLAAKIGLLKAVHDYDLKRVISFHSRVAGAKKFADELLDVAKLIEPARRPEGMFLTDYVSGQMKAGDRKEKIDRLKALEGYQRGILTNARCLAEGVDVPALDGVAFIDPRGSQVEIIQAVGRAIRRVRGDAVQKKGTIVLPVFIETGDDPEASIDASNFKPVWDVLKALRAHDEVLADTLDQYRTNMAKNASQSREGISDKIVVDLPMSVDTEFSSALRTVLVEASTASWEFFFGLLQQFKEREGHCAVATNWLENGFRLGQWAAVQRSFKNHLSAVRLTKLDALGFSWGLRDTQWLNSISHLNDFIAREGHADVPKNHVEGNFKLGAWASKCRSRKSDLGFDKVNDLNDLGFVWDKEEHRWKLGIEALEQFSLRYGHSRVPSKHKEGNFELGKWVHNVRHFKGQHSPEQLHRLKSLGFVWDPFEEEWEAAFLLLQQFSLRAGHCRVPVSHMEGSFRLGGWVNVQRTDREKLSPSRIEKLNSLGFVWDAMAERWHAGFKLLKAYGARNGHYRVPEKYLEDDFPLGSWVKGQKKQIKNGKTSDDRLRILSDLGLGWSDLE